jgi:hypothetical protein
VRPNQLRDARASWPARPGPIDLARSTWPARPGPIDLARSTWPDRPGPIDLARSTWPDRLAPLVLARSTWPDRPGPIDLARSGGRPRGPARPPGAISGSILVSICGRFDERRRSGKRLAQTALRQRFLDPVLSIFGRCAQRPTFTKHRYLRCFVRVGSVRRAPAATPPAVSNWLENRPENRCNIARKSVENRFDGACGANPMASRARDARF